MLYFGLLRANEARDVVVDGFALVKGGGNPRIKLAFTHDRKRQNNGFNFCVSHQYYPIYDQDIKELCQKTIKAGKVQFLKKWNGKGKHRVQNMGNSMINMLHKVAQKILKKSPDPNTSHTWCRSTSTNLAQANVSLINLKRHGERCSNSVVKRYIAILKSI